METQGYIEVLGDVRLGPELFVSIVILVRGLLQGRPTENSVVTGERDTSPLVTWRRLNW